MVGLYGCELARTSMHAAYGDLLDVNEWQEGQ